MQFGNPTHFSIECVHEPFANDCGWVFGRMCVWVQGRQLGDFDAPACMLNVTAGHLRDLIARIPDLDAPELYGLADAELYALLDQALYVDDQRTAAAVAADAFKYGKFNFLTNRGESFDGTKSFIAIETGRVRLLFSDMTAMHVFAEVGFSAFIEAVEAFINWVQQESLAFKRD